MTVGEMIAAMVARFNAPYAIERIKSWTTTYHAELARYEGERLRRAFDTTMAGWKRPSAPPLPAEIKENLPSARSRGGGDLSSRGYCVRNYTWCAQRGFSGGLAFYGGILRERYETDPSEIEVPPKPEPDKVEYRYDSPYWKRYAKVDEATLEAHRRVYGEMGVVKFIALDDDALTKLVTKEIENILLWEN